MTIFQDSLLSLPWFSEGAPWLSLFSKCPFKSLFQNITAFWSLFAANRSPTFLVNTKVILGRAEVGGQPLVINLRAVTNVIASSFQLVVSFLACAMVLSKQQDLYFPMWVYWELTIVYGLFPGVLTWKVFPKEKNSWDLKDELDKIEGGVGKHSKNVKVSRVAWHIKAILITEEVLTMISSFLVVQRGQKLTFTLDPGPVVLLRGKGVVAEFF